MRLGYSNLACPDWNFEKTVEAVRTYGFDGLEVRLFDGEVVTPAMSAQARRRGEAAITSAGVDIVALDTSLQATTLDGPAFLAEVGALAEIAAQWQAPLLRVFGGPLPAEPHQRAETVRRTADRLRQSAEVAGRYGVVVALETHDDFASAHVVAEVLALAGGGVGAVYDAHHPHRLGERPQEVLGLLSGYIELVQVKDAVRVADEQWRLVPIGQGEVPVHEIVRRLPATGYDGWVSLEFEKKWHPELAPPEESLRPQAKLLRQWLAEQG